MVHEAFSALAGHFEELNDGCDYGQWSQYLLERLNFDKADKRGADIGCGEGYFARYFASKGFSMTGIDISAPMIECAKKKAAIENLDIDFVEADIAGEPLYCDEFDFAICANDCLNYVHPKKLLKATSNIAKMLKCGGVFVFDITSAEGLDMQCEETNFDDRENLTLFWDSFIEDREGETALVTNVTLFERQEGGPYRKETEEQVRYFQDEAFLDKCLNRAGFEIEKDYPEFCASDCRIFYMARKTRTS